MTAFMNSAKSQMLVKWTEKQVDETALHVTSGASTSRHNNDSALNLNTVGLFLMADSPSPSPSPGHPQDVTPLLTPTISRAPTPTYGAQHDGSSPSPPSTRSFKKTAYRLYVSHILSTWNTRVFEFGAVLYFATAFPGTLLAMSVYAFVRGLSAIVFASAIGAYIDREDRLKVVRTSIGELMAHAQYTS